MVSDLVQHRRLVGLTRTVPRPSRRRSPLRLSPLGGRDRSRRRRPV